MKQEIEKTLKVLKKGGVILYPTDTVWGLGCDATNQRAVEKIYKIKNRPSEKTMILLLDSFEKLSHYVKKVPSVASDIINNVTTPLTIIYPGARNISSALIGPDGTIAIRLVRDSFCHELVQKLGSPLVSTSANISGEPTPLTYHKISDEVIQKVDYVVDLNRDKVNQLKPSTIIKFTGDTEYTVIRD